MCFELVNLKKVVINGGGRGEARYFIFTFKMAVARNKRPLFTRCNYSVLRNINKRYVFKTLQLWRGREMNRATRFRIKIRLVLWQQTPWHVNSIDQLTRIRRGFFVVFIICSGVGACAFVGNTLQYRFSFLTGRYPCRISRLLYILIN